jgi:signal transduction histidine kinase
MTHAVEARLLIVDDEVGLMQSLCETLRDQGFETVGFTNPAQALAALNERSFDLLLADLAMPNINGIELLREARRTDDKLVAIIMTGEATVATAVEAMRSGAYDYVLKPFKLSAILPVLRRALAMRTLRVENANLERQLREHASDLEARNQELDAFTRTASHDLRSPLTSILGLATLLKLRNGASLTPQGVSLLEQIEQEGQRMVRLLDDLMRLSQSGRGALQIEHVDVKELALEVANELRQREPARTIVVRADALPPASADRGLLRQVIVNLLSNALKFSRGRSETVIQVGSAMADGEAAYYVKDNGVGFDMARAGSLFSPFQRLHRQEDFEGSGVGLTIVQRIVERHGGRIWAESAPDQGARVNFTLRVEELAMSGAGAS